MGGWLVLGVGGWVGGSGVGKDGWVSGGGIGGGVVGVWVGGLDGSEVGGVLVRGGVGGGGGEGGEGGQWGG